MARNDWWKCSDTADDEFLQLKEVQYSYKLQQSDSIKVERCVGSFYGGEVLQRFVVDFSSESRPTVLIMMRQLSLQPRSKKAAAADASVDYAFLSAAASIKCSNLRPGKASSRHQRDRQSRSKTNAAQRHAYIGI